MPWHVPFHRVEAAAAAASARGGATLPQQDDCPLAASLKRLPSPEAAAAGALECESNTACMLHSQKRGVGLVASESSNNFGTPAEDGPAIVGASAADSVHANARGQVGDVFPDGQVDRVKGTVVFKRYYHLFDGGELDSLVHGTPGVRLTASFFDKSNWCIIFQKL